MSELAPDDEEWFTRFRTALLSRNYLGSQQIERAISAAESECGRTGEPPWEIYGEPESHAAALGDRGITWGSGAAPQRLDPARARRMLAALAGMPLLGFAVTAGVRGGASATSSSLSLVHAALVLAWLALLSTTVISWVAGHSRSSTAIAAAATAATTVITGITAGALPEPYGTPQVPVLLLGMAGLLLSVLGLRISWLRHPGALKVAVGGWLLLSMLLIAAGAPAHAQWWFFTIAAAAMIAVGLRQCRPAAAASPGPAGTTR